MSYAPIDPNTPSILREPFDPFKAPRGPLNFPRPQFEIPEEVNRAAAMPPRKKGGIFGQNSFLRYLAGSLGDGLAMSAGMQPAFANSLQQQRAMEMYKQQQADTLAQYEAQQRIKAQYDRPNPHYWEANDGSLMGIGPDGQPQQVYKDPTPKPYMVTNPDGTISPYIFNSTTQQFQPVGVGGATGVGGTAMPPVKGKLRPYGGPTATPSGGFR